MPENVYVVSPTIAVLVSVAIQWAKNSQLFPWLTRETARANMLVGAAVAIVSSVGIVLTFDFNQTTGHFAAGMSGNVWDLAHAVGHAAIQWTLQHAAYKALIVPAEVLGEIRAMVRDVVDGKPEGSKP